MGILDILFPKICLECGRDGKYICAQCLVKVPSARGRTPNVYSLWQYKGVVRKAILKLKYNFAFDVAKELANVCVQEIKYQRLNIKSYVLVPIPLHHKRENWRGFNQANLLGRGISTGLGWKYEEKLLTRKLASIQQVGLTKNERLRNMSGKFEVIEHAALGFKSTDKIIVFDDVYTTGATMNEAIKVFNQAGFKNVLGLTICG